MSQIEKRPLRDELADQPITQNQVEIARIVEGGRTYRYLTVCLTIVAGMICTTIAVVSAMTPSWVTIVTSLLGPAGLLFGLLRLFKEYIVRSNRKFQVMEKMVDPDRTSSEPADEPK